MSPFLQIQAIWIQTSLLISHSNFCDPHNVSHSGPVIPIIPLIPVIPVIPVIRPFRSSGHSSNSGHPVISVIPVIWSSSPSGHPVILVFLSFLSSGHSSHPVIPVIPLFRVIPIIQSVISDITVMHFNSFKIYPSALILKNNIHGN